MIFTRTYRYKSQIPADDIKNRLLGKHVTVHNLDFEVTEKNRMIKVIPHAEEIRDIKTLPITHIDFERNGGNTSVVISSKMRRLDAGGPTMIVIVCTLMLIGAVLSFLVGKNEYRIMTYSLLGLSLFILVVFWFRMQTGYFDYVHKIRDYIKKEIAV